jgi:adenylate cyclase
VRILDFDAASMERFGPWPWPRSVLARLEDELKTAGAALVVYDLPLDAVDDSAARFAALLPASAQTDPLRAGLAKLPDSDTAFATALAAVPSVTGFTLGREGRSPALKAALGVAGHTPSDVADFDVAAGARTEFEAASAGVGARNLPADADGVVRSVPVMLRLNGKPVPTLDAEAIRLAVGAGDIAIDFGESGLPGLESRSIVTGATAGHFQMPLSPNGSLEIYFSGPRPERLVSAAALDQGQVAQGALAGAVIYVAPPGAMVHTPLGLLPRSEVRAEALENVLLGETLKLAAAPEASLAFLVIAGGGLLFLLAGQRVAWAGVLTAGAIAAAQGLGWSLFTGAHMLLDTANPSLALAAAFVSGLAVRHWQVVESRAKLRASFADILPPRAILAIARDPALLNLDGESRTVTCLSLGIRGFAALADSFEGDPVGFTRLVNTALGKLIDVAIAQGGMIAHSDCEGFMACWNAPLSDPEHAIHACEAANRMTVALADVNDQVSRERRLDGTSYPPIEIGIGISTGRAIAGGFAAYGRKTYSVTGDATVQADRIRLLSAQYGPAVVVSDDARKSAQRGYAFLEVDFIAAGTRDEPVKLYAMLGNPLVRASPKFRALETFHDHIFQSVRLQQWDKARGLIEQCRKLSGASQKIYDLHLARIAYFEANPPGRDWDGAFRQILT